MVDVVLSVLEVVEVSLVVVDEGVAVVEVAAADDSTDESEVVVASTLEGALVVVCSAVVFASALEVVFASPVSVEDGSSVVVESALFFSSSCSSTAFSSWHSCANQTAPTAASASEQPPATKHFSISASR